MRFLTSMPARRVPSVRASLLFGAAVLAMGGMSVPAFASVYGTLGNFDVVNDTGKTAHGFEIDLEGISVSDVTDTFGGAGRYFPPTVERYGSPTVTATATGVSIVYEGIFSGGSWNVGTPTGVYYTPGESCWTGGGIGYGPSTPCDHFGVGLRASPTKTTYSWLTEISPHSATLAPVAANLPAPVITVTPPPPPPPPPPGSPPPPPAPPVVMAKVVAPVPAVGDPRFGIAEWVKVFTTQYDHPVALEDLVGGGGIVPQASSETEIEWQLLQVDPGSPGSGQLDLGGAAGVGAESVLRRYEFYKYTGAVDPGTGEALPVNGDSATPVVGDLGAFIGAQNAAVNLNGVFAGPPAAVPEPAGIALFATGLLGLLGLRRRRA